MHKATENEYVPEQEDLLRSYFDQIKRTPLLTFEEELDLSRRIQNGDPKARQKLIEANLRLVVKIAKGFVTSDIQLIDLIQEGNLGLIKAASRYDHARQVRFCTYAAWWIKQSILRALSNKRRTIRIPHRKEEQLKRIQKMRSAMTQNLMREPNLDELASELQMQPSRISSLLNIATATTSLDAEIQSDSGSLIDMCEDLTYCPDRQLIEENLRDRTKEHLDRLKSRERQIIMYRYEFVDGKKFTLKRISKMIGVSPETVRQIEMRALRKLRTEAADLRDCMYT
jgi:RNA polymerase primary sigma factor